MFKNDTELTAALISEMSSIIENITDKLLEKLKRLIEEIVYDPYSPKMYPRQKEHGGLLEEWDTSKPKMSGTTITTEIFEDPKKLNFDPASYIHGSYAWDKQDIRDILVEIIVEGKSGPLFDFGQPPHFWRSPRDFWIPFVQLLTDGTVDLLIEKEFKSRGIKYQKV